MSTVDAAILKPRKQFGETFFGRVWTGLTRSPAGFAGTVLVLGIVLFSFVGPLVVNQDNPTDTTQIWTEPSSAHWLGTQYEGKDTFTILVNSGAEPIWVGTLAALMAVFVAVVFGSAAGYFRGKIDAVLLQLTDVTVTIPQFLLMLAVVAFFDDIPAWGIAFVVGSTMWAFLFRSIRAQVMSLKEREFVEAARLQDLGTARIVFREILPNMAGFIFVNFVIAVNQAIYAIVGLYVLGLMPSGTPNWGLMIHQSWSQNFYLNPVAMPFVLAPLLMIVLFTIGLVTMGRGLDQALNPRLRER
ncbi:MULTISPECIES: ABC transporter permease [Glycomyces]|uniref:ABC transporter permease n=2 Tax=Glycomyces TaxID=58113 RepID=A0A9X3PKQ0_9ACTN|nr:ABC transporter permease [Glycomyces lechevalierae]MDA1387174.1 ABC transporter permease [Glycomyces lechevalierae]MDR7338562.1 peptide/nickel transport system permease protein [Glycomyces lechevalierae]